MQRIWLASVVMVIAACSARSTESSLADASVGYVADCFTSLNPAGMVENNAFQEVHFYNGNCTGSTRALNKLVIKKDVLVVQGADRAKSRLYLDGKTVSVKIAGQTVVIGEMVMNDATEDFQLKGQISFDLMVYDENGDAKAWKFGDTGITTREEIAVFL